MPDRIVTVRTGGVNSGLDWASLQLAWDDVKLNDRFGAGVGVIAADSKFIVQVDGAVAVGNVTLTGINITAANAGVEIISKNNAFNAVLSAALGTYTGKDSLNFGSTGQLLIQQHGIHVHDLILRAGASTYAVIESYPSTVPPAGKNNRFERLIVNHYSGGSARGFKTNGQAIIRRCLVIFDGAPTAAICVYGEGTSGVPPVIEHVTMVAPGSNTATISGRFYHNNTDPPPAVKNCYAGGLGAGVWTLNIGSYDAASTGNASDEGTPPGTSGITSVALSTANFQNITVGSLDLRVQSASVLKTTGAARLASSLTDIYNQAALTPTTIGAHAAEAVVDTTAPLITGPSGAAGAATSAKDVAENTAAVHTFTANETVTWSLNGGADVALFTINSTTGALSFLTGRNFEAPGDVGGDNLYVVGVRATDTAGNASTQTVTITVTNVVELPGAPTIGTATAGAASASVAFTPPAGNGSPAPTSYTATSSPGGITGTGASSPITVAGLASGTAYTFTVAATNSDGTGPASAASNSVTPTASADTTPPTLTGMVTASAITHTTATLTWPAGADNIGVAGYDYRLNGGAWQPLGNVQTYGLTGLTPATLYNCDVRARDAAGNVSTPVISGSLTTSAAPPAAATTASFLLTTDGTAPAANLSNLKFAFFDEATPNLWTAPKLKGSNGSTNGSGVMTLNITGQTALVVGQTGSVAVTNSDGTPGQGASLRFTFLCVAVS